RFDQPPALEPVAPIARSLISKFGVDFYARAQGPFSGYRISDVGCWMSDVGCRCRMLNVRNPKSQIILLRGSLPCWGSLPKGAGASRPVHRSRRRVRLAHAEGTLRWPSIYRRRLCRSTE